MIQKLKCAFSIFSIVCSSAMTTVAAPITLQKDFVYVTDVDSSIQEDIRYATNRNITDRQLKGFKKGRAILTREAAEALSHVQEELLKDGYSLVIYDAYRPESATKDLIEWSTKKANFRDEKIKEQCYPRLSKDTLQKNGYLAAMSPHSRGSSVSVTLIKIKDKLVTSGNIVTRQLEDGTTIAYLGEGTVDMGSGFDLLDEASAHNSKLIAKQYLENREYLAEKMKKNGFKANPMLWWEYTLENEPFPNTYFNFEVL